MAVSASPRLTPRMVAFWETAAVKGRSSVRRRTRRTVRSTRTSNRVASSESTAPRMMSGMRRWSARAVSAAVRRLTAESPVAASVSPDSGSRSCGRMAKTNRPPTLTNRPLNAPIVVGVARIWSRWADSGRSSIRFRARLTRSAGVTWSMPARSSTIGRFQTSSAAGASTRTEVLEVGTTCAEAAPAASSRARASAAGRNRAGRLIAWPRDTHGPMPPACSPVASRGPGHTSARRCPRG